MLTPAVEVFAAEGRLPDLFARYDLPLSAADPAEILARIDNCVSVWNRLKQNKKYSYLLSALLDPQELERSRALLSDPERRATERAAAQADRRARQDRLLHSLDESLQVVASKGYYTGEELDKLRDQYQEVPEAEILERLQVPRKDGREDLPADEGLPASVRQQLRNNLSVLGLKDLGAFLGLEPPWTVPALEERHRQLSDDWLARAPDFRRAAAQELLGIVKTRLVEGDPGCYEAALRWEAVEQLRPRVELAAADRRITRVEFSALMDQAARLGLDAERSRDYILALAEKFGAHVEWSAQDSARCGFCFATLQRGGGDHCPTCGQPVWLTCPRCSLQMASSDSACPQCGFVLAHLLGFREARRRALAALQAGDLPRAGQEAREALRLWGGRQGECAELLEAVEARSRQLEEIRRKVEDSLAAGRLFEARAGLADLVEGAPGFVDEQGHEVEVLREQVTSRLARYESALLRARGLQEEGATEEAAQTLQQALREAVDGVEARTWLEQMPPAPSPEVRAVAEEPVWVHWERSPSLGAVVYRVFRCEGERQVELLTTTGLECTDPEAPTGRPLAYQVVTEREGVGSEPALSAPLLVPREVAGLDVRVGPDRVEIRWEPPEGGRVRVLRGGGVELPVLGSECCDEHLEEAEVLSYRVLLEYPGGVRSNGRSFQARPAGLPAALEDWALIPGVWGPEFSTDAAISQACASPTSAAPQDPIGARAEVGFFRVTAPFGPPGTLLWRSELEALGHPLGARDPAPPTGRTSYLPVSRSGDVAVVGRVLSYVHTPPVEGLTARDLGGYLQLLWVWPPGCRMVRVTWRSDRPPEAPDDPAARWEDFPLGRYESQGGFRLSAEDRPYCFTLFTGVAHQGEWLFGHCPGPGSQVSLRLRPPLEVRYELARGGLFEPGRVRLRFKAEREVDLPEVVVVARKGDLRPLRREDGEELARLSGLQVRGGEARAAFSAVGLRRPAYLRAFFLEAPAYEQFILVDPPARQLLWR